MNTLRLPLKKKWFEMTKNLIKGEEYREITHYWIKRIMTKKYNVLYPIEQEAIDGIIKHIDPNFLVKHHSKHFDTTTLTLGYPSNSGKDRIIEFENLGISIGYGKEEWGAEKDKLYFVIKHGKRVN